MLASHTSLPSVVPHEYISATQLRRYSVPQVLKAFHVPIAQNQKHCRTTATEANRARTQQFHGLFESAEFLKQMKAGSPQHICAHVRD